MEKKVLIVTYHFPPSGSIGYKRPMEFAKYLPYRGWKPLILTTKRKGDKITDFSLMDNVPKNLCIYKANSVELFKYKRILHKKLSPKSEKDSSLGFKKLFKICLFYILKAVHILLADYILIPDTMIGWLPFATLCGVRIIKSERVDVIYATAPPYTSLLIGYFLKLITKRSLVVDYRDPWSFNPFHPYRSKIRKYIEEFLEYLVLKRCDACVTISDAMTYFFRKKFPRLGQKFTTITNGFDPDDYESCAAKTFDKFTLLYSGSLYKMRSPRYFLQALEQLYYTNSEIKKRSQFLIFGTIENEVIEPLAESGLLQLISMPIRYLPHREIIEHMKGADVLVLIMDERNIFTIPAKLFEYLAVGRPILGLTPEGPAADLIKKTKSGVVVAPKNINDIKTQIHTYYKKYLSHTNTTETSVSQYSYEILTDTFSDVLNRLYVAYKV